MCVLRCGGKGRGGGGRCCCNISVKFLGHASMEDLLRLQYLPPQFIDFYLAAALDHAPSLWRGKTAIFKRQHVYSRLLPPALLLKASPCTEIMFKQTHVHAEGRHAIESMVFKLHSSLVTVQTMCIDGALILAWFSYFDLRLM